MLHIINLLDITGNTNSYPGTPLLICVFSALLAGSLMYTFVRLLQEKRHGKKLESYLTELENVLGEFRKVRHQYNNMFQSIICYMENEEWDQIKDFKDEILKKTAASNKNNILKLVKIKNYKIRSSISRIVEACDKNKIDLNIIISGEINTVNMSESALCRVIEIYFGYIFDRVLRSNKKEIKIEACSDSQGFTLVFESTFDTAPGTFERGHFSMSGTPEGEKCPLTYARSNTGKLAHCSTDWSCGPAAAKKILQKNRNVIFNNFIDKDHFRQEIMVPEKR